MQSQVRIEDCPKRIRVLFGGECIVDTRKAKSILLSSSHVNPQYFFPKSELDEKYLGEAPQDEAAHLEYRDLVVGDKRAVGAVQRYTKIPELVDLVKITFSAADAWFEEEKQIVAPPKDPSKRIDVVQSSQHVRVEIEGEEVANTHKPRLLFETGRRVRTYIVKADCRTDLLEPSKLTTRCPFKGIANYYDVRLPTGKVVKDVVWYYQNPVIDIECAGIVGCVAFYDEKVDVWVDGEKVS